MEIEIKRLSPELAEDYVNFFDSTPHNTNEEEDRCYCVGWCNADDSGLDFSTAEKRRGLALGYVRGGNIQGYLAYEGGRVVGWCNANAKAGCHQCRYGRMYMPHVDRAEASAGVRVKSVFCFALAPDWRGKGLADLLLKRVCEDAEKEGFDFVEAYPNKNFMGGGAECMGPAALFERLGFTPAYEIGPKLVMRKGLKPSARI